MNIITVATDFSPAADNAALYAAQLAEKLSASIHLLHVYEMPISMNDVPIMMVSAEELKNNADRGLSRVKELILKNHPQLLVQTESRLGDVGIEIGDYSKEQTPLLMVAGKHGATGVERFLFGTSALSIIRHAKVPVVTVPENITQCSIQNIALAVDNNDAEKHQLFIENVSRQLSAQLHIVHVKQHREDALQTEGLLSGLQPKYHTVTNEDFVNGLESFANTHSIDLLIILPHEHTWMERVFFKTHTAELLQKIRIPILSLPEEKRHQ